MGSVYTSSRRVFGLLVNLLDWSRINNGSLKCSPRFFSLSHLISEVFDLYQEQAVNKGVRLINAMTSEAEVYADYNILHTLLRNLIGNSIRFTAKGGFIRVSFLADEKGYILTVEDNGIGISDEKLSKLFDKDFFGDKEHPESGTGLGLIICKELVELCRGTLEISSKLNSGTMVKCTFPLS